MFLFVWCFLLGETHIKIQSKKKLTRLFTSLLIHLNCYSFALVQRYNTAPQNLKTNLQKTPRRHKKNPDYFYTDFCLLGSLTFTSLCSSSLSPRAGVCGISAQACWFKWLFINWKMCQAGRKDLQTISESSGLLQDDKELKLYLVSQTALLFYFTIWCEGQCFEVFPKHGNSAWRMCLWPSGRRTQAEGQNSKAASCNAQV